MAQPAAAERLHQITTCLVVAEAAMTASDETALITEGEKRSRGVIRGPGPHANRNRTPNRRSRTVGFKRHAGARISASYARPRTQNSRDRYPIRTAVRDRRYRPMAAAERDWPGRKAGHRA
jgi:hypothetical protein